MPLYDYQCQACDHVIEDAMVSSTGLAQWSEPEPNKCTECEAGFYQRMSSVEGLKGFQPFEAHFNPALDCDINGRGELKEAMGFYDVVPAGDSRHGARNWEQSGHSAGVDVTAPTGRRLSDIQRERERGREEARQNWAVQTENKDGSVSSPKKVDDLKNPSTAAKLGKFNRGDTK